MTITQGAITLTLEKALDIMNTVGFCQGVLFIRRELWERNLTREPFDEIKSCCLSGSIMLAADIIEPLLLDPPDPTHLSLSMPDKSELVDRSVEVAKDVLHLTEGSSLANWNDAPRRTKKEVIVALEKSVALSIAKER